MANVALCCALGGGACSRSHRDRVVLRPSHDHRTASLSAKPHRETPPTYSPWLAVVTVLMSGPLLVVGSSSIHSKTPAISWVSCRRSCASWQSMRAVPAPGSGREARTGNTKTARSIRAPARGLAGWQVVITLAAVGAIVGFSSGRRRGGAGRRSYSHDPGRLAVCLITIEPLVPLPQPEIRYRPQGLPRPGDPDRRHAQHGGAGRLQGRGRHRAGQDAERRRSARSCARTSPGGSSAQGPDRRQAPPPPRRTRT